MPHELKRLVDLRRFREAEAERVLGRQRAALLAAEQQRERDRQALQRIEDSARDARQSLAEPGLLKAGAAHDLLAYAASRRHGARDAVLRVRRADAEVAQAERQVQAARDDWQLRVRAHAKMREQAQALARVQASLALRRQEDALADEHLEGWLARQLAAGPA